MEKQLELIYIGNIVEEELVELDNRTLRKKCGVTIK